MQSINIYEKGIGYLSAVMSVYMDSCAYFVLYLLGLLYILIKGDKRDKEIFIPASIVMFLTIYNPVVPLLLNKFFDVNSEYYRLFWIAPVVVLTGYIATRIIFDAKRTSEKVVAILLLLLIGLGAGSFAYKDGYKAAENIYQIPDELIRISELIHEDSETEYPKAFFEYEYNMQIRQYDARMQLTIDRDDYVRAVTEDYPADMIENDECPQYRILAALVRGQDVDEDAFIWALENTKTEYVVLSKGNIKEDFVKEAGLREVADTDNHVIYKYDIEEPYIYEPVDYSVAEHRFCLRRLK